MFKWFKQLKQAMVQSAQALEQLSTLHPDPSPEFEAFCAKSRAEREQDLRALMAKHGITEIR